MRSGFLLALIGAMMAVAPLQAIADGWSRYTNARFAYVIDVPPGFEAIAEADNGDGGVARSALGHAELRVWGGYVMDSSVESEAEERIGADRVDGWAISYRRTGSYTASWSGQKGARVFYQRTAKGCNSAYIHFHLEYDRDDLDAYNNIIIRLARSLKPIC
jgi:hypothetical protein